MIHVGFAFPVTWVANGNQPLHVRVASDLLVERPSVELLEHIVIIEVGKWRTNQER